MTDLFDRLFPVGIDEDNIAVHYFWAAVVDYAAGETNRAEIITHWSLDPDAQADLNALCDAIDGMAALPRAGFLLELHAVMCIAEGGVKYATKPEFKTRMGL